ncbi:MAG TPA: tetratricopeptide repeat protein [Magnetospirillaceae bacterium]|nr:tetratricopeptide repeat protein [Magnetospirillaceae bacterium]
MIRRTARAERALAAALLLAAMSSCASFRSHQLALAYYEVGNAWLEMERWDRAGAAYEKALYHDPSLIAASYNLARALTEAGSHARAQEILLRLLKGDPDNVRLLTLRAYAFHRAGDAASALAAYRRAAELNPRDAPTLRNLAILLERAGREAEARGILSELHSVDASDDAVLRRLALLEARRDPDDLPVGSAAQQGVAGEGARAPDAEALLSSYLARNPGDREVLRARAELRERRELFARSMEDWTAIAGADPTDAEAWFRLARIRLVAAGDGAAGRDALRRALQAGFSNRAAAVALLTALPEAEREEPAKLLRDAGLVD